MNAGGAGEERVPGAPRQGVRGLGAARREAVPIEARRLQTPDLEEERRRAPVSREEGVAPGANVLAETT
jgi:hypothetical protein